MERNNEFLKKEYRKTLFPIMFSILGGTATSMIDTLLVSLCLGKEGLAAVNLCMPVFLLLCAAAILTSAGTSILSAREEGKEEGKNSEVYYFNGISLGLAEGILILVLGCVFGSRIASWLTQNGPLFEPVREYTRVLYIGAIPYILAYLPLDYLQLEGKGNAISIMMVITIVSDAVLDILFLFIFPFRYYGAAAASVLSMLFAAAYGIYTLQKSNAKYRIEPGKLRLKHVKEILVAGSPSASVSLCDALKMVLLNALLLSAGGTDVIAVWAVITVFAELSRIATAGVPQTAAPMLGVLSASHENTAIRLLTKIECRTGTVALTLYGILLLLLNRQIGAVYQVGDSLLFPFFCLLLSFYMELLAGIWTTEFYAVGEVKLANLLSFFRSLLFPVLCAWGIITVYRRGLWIFLPLSGLCTVAIMAVLTGWIAKRRSVGEHCFSKILLLDDILSKTGRLLEFSIRMSEQDICEASEKIGEFCSQNDMNQKMVNRLGLAIEEYLMIIKEKNDKIKSVDLRATNLDGITMIRVRSSGKRYNPFESDEEELGIQMIHRMASRIQFSYVLGINNIDIIFQIEEKGNIRTT